MHATAQTAEQPLVTRPFVMLVCAQFLQALGYSSTPLLPLYLEDLGARHAQLGTIMAASAFGGLALRPAVGWALDRFGRRPTLVVGTLVVSITMIGLLGVRAISPYVYILRAVYGMGIGALFSGYFALAADIVPEHRRTEGIALFGVAGLTPLALNPFFAELGLAPADLRYYFAALGVAIALSLFFLMQVDEAPRPAHREGPGGPFAVIRALSTRTLVPVWMATIVFSGMVALYFTFVSVAAEHRGIERSTAVWLTYASGAICVRLVGARIPDRVGTHNMVAPALGIFCTSYLLIAAGSTLTAFLVGGLLAGLGHGYCFPVLTSQVVTRVDDAHRGSAMAMFTALWDVSSIALAPLFGIVADLHGDAVMFSLAAVCAVAGLAVWAFLERWLGGHARM